MASRANRPNVGPYTLLLHMPELAQRLEALRTYLRDETRELLQDRKVSRPTFDAHELEAPAHPTEKPLIA